MRQNAPTEFQFQKIFGGLIHTPLRELAIHSRTASGRCSSVVERRSLTGTSVFTIGPLGPCPPSLTCKNLTGQKCNVRNRALCRAGRAAAAGLFCNAAAANKNASARRHRRRRRRFRGRRAAVKVSYLISFNGENLHAAYNFWYLSASLLQFRFYLFMKMLQHLKTTKLGYSCILYPCLYWCVKLELVSCRLNLWWCQTCCRMDYEITILQIT